MPPTPMGRLQSSPCPPHRSRAAACFRTFTQSPPFSATFAQNARFPHASWYHRANFSLRFLAGENGLIGVDDDDKVTAVYVGGEVGLVLAPQQVGGNHSGPAQGLARCVENVPLALYGLLLE